jgi:hypothetical protein
MPEMQAWPHSVSYLDDAGIEELLFSACPPVYGRILGIPEDCNGIFSRLQAFSQRMIKFDHLVPVLRRLNDRYFCSVEKNGADGILRQDVQV